MRIKKVNMSRNFCVSTRPTEKSDKLIPGKQSFHWLLKGFSSTFPCLIQCPFSCSIIWQVIYPPSTRVQKYIKDIPPQSPSHKSKFLLPSLLYLSKNSASSNLNHCTQKCILTKLRILDCFWSPIPVCHWQTHNTSETWNYFFLLLIPISPALDCKVEMRWIRVVWMQIQRFFTAVTAAVFLSWRFITLIPQSHYGANTTPNPNSSAKASQALIQSQTNWIACHQIKNWYSSYISLIHGCRPLNDCLIWWQSSCLNSRGLLQFCSQCEI